MHFPSAITVCNMHVRYLTRRYYPELYRSLRFYGIFVISASFKYIYWVFYNIFSTITLLRTGFGWDSNSGGFC